MEQFYTMVIIALVNNNRTIASPPQKSMPQATEQAHEKLVFFFFS